uniref:Uncharacterized protein n=1 Tax=viral metagenome TaxID=1070528 RepID=A0A6M3L509_9ZZZZ
MIRVLVENAPYGNAANFAVVREVQGGLAVLQQRVGESGDIVLTWKELLEDEQIKPTFSLPLVLWGQEILQELVDGVKKVYGVTARGQAVDNEIVVQLEDHLNTLKHLVFTSTFIKIERGEPLEVDVTEEDLEDESNI